MKNLVFILWMVLWPISCAVSRYINIAISKSLGREYPEDDIVTTAKTIEGVIFIIVAWILWHAKS